MKVIELIRLARQRLDDTGGDTSEPDWWEHDDSGLLWGNEELIGYLDEAQSKAARVVPIGDNSTDDVTLLDITKGQSTYTYDRRILYLEAVEWIGEGPLAQTWRSEVLDSFWPDDGPTRAYLNNADQNQITLYPSPDRDFQARLWVRRLPLRRLAWARAYADEPEISARYHEDLVDWVCYRALTKNDADVQNVQHAEFHRSRFLEVIGLPPNRDMEQAGKEAAGVDRPMRTRSVY